MLWCVYRPFYSLLNACDVCVRACVCVCTRARLCVRVHVHMCQTDLGVCV